MTIVVSMVRLALDNWRRRRLERLTRDVVFTEDVLLDRIKGLR